MDKKARGKRIFFKIDFQKILICFQAHFEPSNVIRGFSIFFIPDTIPALPEQFQSCI